MCTFNLYSCSFALCPLQIAGVEIIPCFSGKSNQVIIVTSKSESPEGSHAGGKECHNPVSDSVGGGVVIIWNIFIGLVPAFLLLSIAYSLRGLLINRGPVGAEVAMFDILRYNWIHFQQECDLTEVWIGFIAWSFTNLFIRRLLNPEIGLSAFEKYGGDSIFGGFSAACTVLLKAVLKKSLKDLQSGI